MSSYAIFHRGQMSGGGGGNVLHSSLILIAYAIIPKVISLILLLMTKMFSDIFSLAL